MNTADLQALTRPEVTALLEDFGRDVLLVRPGAADVPLRAILMPWSDESKDGVNGAEPVVRSTAWFCLLDHTAPVHTLGFSVKDPATNRVYIPDAPPEDVGNLQVAFVLRLHPLVERTRLYTLTFSVPGTGTTTLPNGNVQPAPGTNLQVPVRLEASTDPRIADNVGADNADVVLVGRWGTLEAPSLKPTGVRWGATSPLALDGQLGALTLQLAWPDTDLATEQQFGARFVATWRAQQA